MIRVIDFGSHEVRQAAMGPAHGGDGDPTRQRLLEDDGVDGNMCFILVGVLYFCPSVSSLLRVMPVTLEISWPFWLHSQ